MVREARGDAAPSVDGSQRVAERNLPEVGEHHRLRKSRMFFQYPEGYDGPLLVEVQASGDAQRR